MWKDPYDEYAQYERNRTLSFALASMMYDPWTSPDGILRIVVEPPAS